MDNVITNYAIHRSEIKSRIAMAKAAFDNNETLFTSKLDLNLRRKLIKFCVWSIALYDAETGHF